MAQQHGDERFSLTRRQREVYRYLVDQQERFQRQPPTLDQLCQDLGLKSRGSLHKHIHALIDVGLVEPIAGLRRGVRLSNRYQSPPSDGDNFLPFVGRIAAGMPIDALEQCESLEVPPHLRGGRDCFVLQVVGESMVEDGILDGDYVVVEQCHSARNGEIVVALIDQEEATLKRIEQRPGEVVLHPANRQMRPLRYAPAQVQVQGVVVGQMRGYGRRSV